MGVINRECPKCGDCDARCKWDGVFDRIDLTCDRCGYTWSRQPLDKPPAAPTPNPQAEQ